MTGQWAYAEHNADTIGGNHNHALDCAICLNEGNEQGTLAPPSSPLTQYQYSPPISGEQPYYYAVPAHSYRIRAPPVDQ